MNVCSGSICGGLRAGAEADEPADDRCRRWGRGPLATGSGVTMAGGAVGDGTGVGWTAGGADGDGVGGGWTRRGAAVGAGRRGGSRHAATTIAMAPVARSGRAERSGSGCIMHVSSSARSRSISTSGARSGWVRARPSGSAPAGRRPAQGECLPALDARRTRSVARITRDGARRRLDGEQAGGPSRGPSPRSAGGRWRAAARWSPRRASRRSRRPPRPRGRGARRRQHAAARRRP